MLVPVRGLSAGLNTTIVHRQFPFQPCEIIEHSLFWPVSTDPTAIMIWLSYCPVQQAARDIKNVQHKKVFVSIPLLVRLTVGASHFVWLDWESANNGSPSTQHF